MTKSMLLAASAAVALNLGFAGGSKAQPNFIGNVCGVPIWHHNTGAVLAFQIKPTSALPAPLTPSSLYMIPLGAPFPPATTVGPNAYGRIVTAVDVNLRQALGQQGCFDVYDLTFSSDDGDGFFTVDHDVPSE